MSAARHSAGGSSLSVSVVPPALSSQWAGGAGGGGALVAWVAWVSSCRLSSWTSALLSVIAPRSRSWRFRWYRSVSLLSFFLWRIGSG